MTTPGTGTTDGVTSLRGSSRAWHHVVLGDSRHGVTAAGRALLPAGPAPTILPAPATAREAGELARQLPDACEAPGLHVHVTDGLLGDDPAAALTALAGGRSLALSLHDLPQEGEGRGRFERRRRIYGALIDLAEVVLVASEHERRVVRELRPHAAAHVVPLAVAPPDELVDPSALETGTVGILGWLYPGKGHEAVLHAMASAIPGGTLVALGAPSAGHEDMPGELASIARSLGLQLEVTGYVPAAHLRRRAREIAVPVCAHLHVSASASLGSWLTAGRRPVVVEGPYAREVLDRVPGSLELCDPSDLGAAIARAAADPPSTVLTADVARLVGPRPDQARAAQEQALAASPPGATPSTPGSGEPR